jgi:hypothetical protein
VSRARQRRRLMRWEQYHRRARDLGAVTSSYGPEVSPGHDRAREVVWAQLERLDHRAPWTILDPGRERTS